MSNTVTLPEPTYWSTDGSIPVWEVSGCNVWGGVGGIVYDDIYTENLDVLEQHALATLAAVAHARGEVKT